MATFSQLNLAEDGAGLLFMLNNGVKTHATERTGQPQQVDSFQHAGFTAAVVAVQDIDAGEGENVTGCKLRTAVTVTRLRDI